MGDDGRGVTYDRYLERVTVLRRDAAGRTAYELAAAGAARGTRGCAECADVLAALAGLEALTALAARGLPLGRLRGPWEPHASESAASGDASSTAGEAGAALDAGAGSGSSATFDTSGFCDAWHLVSSKDVPALASAWEALAAGDLGADCDSQPYVYQEEEAAEE
jgi:hypothetical protein